MIQAALVMPDDARRGEGLEVERVEGDDEVALGHERGHAADDERDRQRRDEGVDAEARRDDAVGDADEEAHEDARRDRQRRSARPARPRWRR